MSEREAASGVVANGVYAASVRIAIACGFALAYPSQPRNSYSGEINSDEGF